MMKSGPDRRYTGDFRQTAVKQVIDGGRSIQQVALSLEMPKGDPWKLGIAYPQG